MIYLQNFLPVPILKRHKFFFPYTILFRMFLRCLRIVSSATNEVWRRYCDRYHLSVCPSVCHQDSGHSFECTITIFGTSVTAAAACGRRSCSSVRRLFRLTAEGMRDIIDTRQDYIFCTSCC